MAATVTTLIQGTRRVVLQLDNDGGAEAAVTKLDISTLLNGNGDVPTKIAIEEVQYDIQGYDNVLLTTDRTSDGIDLNLSGQGAQSWVGVGGLTDKGTGNTGDLQLTTSGTGGFYSITVSIKVKS